MATIRAIRDPGELPSLSANAPVAGEEVIRFAPDRGDQVICGQRARDEDDPEPVSLADSGWHDDESLRVLGDASADRLSILGGMPEHHGDPPT